MTGPEEGRPALRVSLAGRVRTGRAVNLADAGLCPRRVVREVRDPAGAVECPEPGPAHAAVGLVAPDVTLDRRAALAAAARSRGRTAPQDASVAAARRALADNAAAVGDDGTREARRRLAAVGDEATRLREGVAALRGRVEVLRERGDDAGRAEALLRERVRALSEVETERAAAEQALERARERARGARDARERRLRFEDRLANAERAARAHLAAAVRPAVERAVGTAPAGAAAACGDADPVADADDVTVALAVARVASLRAPVVLACRRFPDAVTAGDWLDAPVVRL